MVAVAGGGVNEIRIGCLQVSMTELIYLSGGIGRQKFIP